VKLQLFWHHQFEFAGFYAAIHKGYFDKYNIKVELLEYKPMLDTTSVVLNDNAQFGIAGTEIIASYHQGKDVKLLASYFKHSPLTIITQPEITSLKQLINQKVYGNSNQLKQGGIRGMLNLYDVDPEKINIMMTGDAVELFKNKKIAGIFAFKTNLPYDLNQQNIPYRVYDPNQFGMISQDLNLFTTGRLAENNPVLVKNLTLAANEGWRYAIKHPNEIINLIKSNYNTQKKSLEALKFEANETIKLISPELFSVGIVQENKLAHISEKLFKNKIIPEIKNLDGFIFQVNNERLIAPELLSLLTVEEKKYLSEHPVIKVQNEDDYPPFNYSVNNKPTGYSIDYVERLSEKMGVKIQFIQNKSWQQYLEMLSDNKLDAMVNIVETTPRKQFYNFTSAFAESNTIAVTSSQVLDNVINDQTIKNKKLVVVTDYAGSDKYEKKYPSMTIIKVTNVLQALKKITEKKADIFISNDAVVNFYIEKYYIAGLRLIPLAKELEYPNSLLSIATNITNPILASIFQKTMSTIPEHETLALRKKWLGEIIKPDKISINLTQPEKQYLRNNPIIRVQNDGNYPPFNYMIDGKPSGYSIDLINLMVSMLGVNVELIKGKSWVEYMSMLKRNEIDVLINTIDIESRRSFARFTEPYFEIATFAVSRTNEFNAIISRDQLAGKRIALTKGYAINDKLKELLPQSIFIPVKDTAAALNLISSNQADVYFEAVAVLDYYMTKNMMSNLQLVPISSDLEVDNQYFSLATNKYNTRLLSILQKTLNAIPDIEQIKLKRKWFGGSKNSQPIKEKFTLNELDFISKTSLTLCRPSLSQGSDWLIPLIDLITRNVGLNIKVSETLQWSETLKALNNKECDIVLEATETERRSELYNFTPTYFRDKLAITTKKEQKTIYDISDHLSESFGILKGSSSIALLKNHYPKIQLIEVDSALDGIELIQKNITLGFIYPTNFISNLFKNHDLSLFKINSQLREQFDDLQAIATRKEDNVLHNILTKALANTDNSEIVKLINHSHLSNANLAIKLSSDEQSLLKTREIKLCAFKGSLDWMGAMPFFLQSIDMQLIKSQIFTWEQALSALENGECDFLPEITPTASRIKTMSFTPLIHQEEHVIVTTSDKNFINNIEDYSQETFTVLKGDLLVEQLLEDYPYLKIQQVNNYLDGMQLVQNNLAFAHIGSISNIGAVISKYTLQNLKISGSLPDKFNNKWSIATRKDDVYLNSILSKITLSLDKKEFRKMLFNDITVKYEQGFDYTLFWQMLFVALVLIFAVIFWNRRLSALNLLLIISKKTAEDAQRKVESQNREILATQQQLVQSEKMASLGTLTAGVAHEINNPTNFAYAAVFMMQNEIDDIKAFLKQLAGGENADDKVISAFDVKFDKLIKLTKTAREGTQRIKATVEDLRSFARLDNAKQAEIRVSDLIKSTVNLVQTQYENIIISTNFHYDPAINCFPSKLNQVFMNIIVNACQSIETKIEQNHLLEADHELVGLITISSYEHNNYLVIQVKDNGCGMDKQTQQKVCEPFFTTKGVGSGTGLGMAISFGIIEEHDGMLRITSTLNHGSDFSIYLPVESVHQIRQKTIKE
tara:strand:- start:9648 stop:14405 length:4758 start_codon:yes stop_codon:yes gene_type:complete